MGDSLGGRTASVQRATYALCLVLVAGLGCATILYRGPGSDWVSHQLGGVFYVLAWIFLVLAAFPGLPPSRVCLVVLAVTCTLEFLQLWNPPTLQAVRATYAGHLLLGSTFSWSDFPYYGVGAVAGLVVTRAIAGRGSVPAVRERPE